MNHGQLSAVGNTVYVANARYKNTIGAAELWVLWRDPEFSAVQEAFYYARVIEIPTPRYTTYDAQVVGVQALAPARLYLLRYGLLHVRESLMLRHRPSKLSKSQ